MHCAFCARRDQHLCWDLQSAQQFPQGCFYLLEVVLQVFEIDLRAGFKWEFSQAVFPRVFAGSFSEDSPKILWMSCLWFPCSGHIKVLAVSGSTQTRFIVTDWTYAHIRHSICQYSRKSQVLEFTIIFLRTLRCIPNKLPIGHTHTSEIR